MKGFDNMFNEKDFEVINKEIFHLGKKTNICLFSLLSGMEVIGSCFTSKKEMGEELAEKNAIKSLERLKAKMKADE